MTEDMQPTLPKFGNLTPELKLPDSCTVVTWEWSQFTALQRRWAFPLSALSCSCAGGWRRCARGYPAEDLCETYHLTPEQLSRAATTPVFSNAFEPLAAGR